MPGFHSADLKGSAGLLTLRGLYPGLYRVASRSQHASVDALDACVDAASYPWVVHTEVGDELLWSAIAIPLFALALLAVDHRLGWPDPDDVRRINNRLHGMHTPTAD